MAGELVSFGIQKLWDLLSHEHKQFQGVKDQVTELKTDLNKLKSFMKDADAKKHTSARVRNCVEVIKEIIFDAEDIIETFIIKDELGKNGGIKKRVRRLACIIPERRKVALEIGSLSKRISNVIRDMETFGVQQIIADMRDPQPLQERQEFAREYESNLVGLEANVETLVRYLVEKDNVPVVSITGMGGLGKTTIARQAFNHEMVKKNFDRLAWVCVSQVCDRKNVWQTILQSFRPKAEENEILQMTEARLQDELSGLLETSNSLIVIDDIWKEEDWNLIKPIFPDKKGWKVLLTSRNERAVGLGETYFNFKPKCLSDEDSWTLFQRIAMRRKDASELKNVAKEMEEMGKKMLDHCGGLPLAIRVLGGLLAENYTVHYWKRVSENIGSHLIGTSDDKKNSFNRVLSLSFEELPGYLKHCFLYLAHFPEDYEINIEKLHYYWAAEGILKYNDGETIRDVGDSYIEELVRRNMVISERDNTTWRFETCRLHDVMRDLCLSKAKEENFLQIVDISSSTAHSQSLSTSRRFVSQYPTTLDVEREINNSKVRSLVVIGKDYWNLSGLSFTRLQLLRVLDLRRAEFKGGKLPFDIGKLIHLRYLSLENAKVSHLPSSLGNLKLLIYLNLKVFGRSIFVPNVLMGMKELRYLGLPWSMHKKTKLELSNLVNLETLENFSTENCSLEDIRGMARLRTLYITLTGESSLETLSASIGELRHLEILFIVYEGVKGTKEWRSLFEFNNLQQLLLHINIPLLSDELQLPSRLTSLSLQDCRLEEDPMPILEKLGQLKVVFLGSNAFCGRRMVCSKGGFPHLQTLLFSGLYEWEEWTVQEGSMPLLHTLDIWDCNKLKELPDGLQFITSLKDLTVYNRKMVEKWKKRLSEGGEDYYKVQHIPSVTFFGN